jgi:formiminotetrahydrofolate cyclodeaminase
LLKLPLDQYLQQLAGNAPAPGGGAATALTAAQAAALLSMVVNVTTKGAKDRQDEWTQELRDDLEDTRERLTALAAADAAAFVKVMQAYALPKASEAEKTARGQAVEIALHGATEVPLQLLRELAALTASAALVIDRGSKHVLSDAGIAVVLLRAAAKASKNTLMINLQMLKDESFRAEAAAEMKKLLTYVKSQEKELKKRIEAKL